MAFEEIKKIFLKSHQSDEEPLLDEMIDEADEIDALRICYHFNKSGEKFDKIEKKVNDLIKGGFL